MSETDLDRIEWVVHNTRLALDYRVRNHDWDNDFVNGLEMDRRMAQLRRFRDYLRLKREFER